RRAADALRAAGRRQRPRPGRLGPPAGGRVMSDDVLVMRGVTREYEVGGRLTGGRGTLRALRGIDLTVARGSTLGLVGESGCGKSTLARLLLGIEQPTAGTVLVGGRPIADYRRLDRARLIQPVFQDPYSSLNPRMT